MANGIDLALNLTLDGKKGRIRAFRDLVVLARDGAHDVNMRHGPTGFTAQRIDDVLLLCSEFEAMLPPE